MAKNRPQPEQQAPPAQWLRVRYAKRGRARFTSHRDFQRALERALRRAAVPMAYSSGFNPHPRISFANAAPTGAATEADFLELGTSEVCDVDKVRAALNDALPTGLDILDVVAAERGTLADRLVASQWRIQLAPATEGLAAAASAFLAAEHLEVQRMTKSGLRTFDVREAVIRLEIIDTDLGVVIRHTTPLVRPDDVLTALASLGAGIDTAGALLTRLAQGPLDGDRVGDPLAE